MKDIKNSASFIDFYSEVVVPTRSSAFLKNVFNLRAR